MREDKGRVPADAFDVVVPSLPGYGFSESRTSKGGLFGFGDLWHALMTETLDSPTGLAAWLIEKFNEWSDCGGDLERCYTKDDLLTNTMIYWLTGTIESSFQPYYDIVHAGAVRWTKEKAKELMGSAKTPTGFALFPKGVSSPPRTIVTSSLQAPAGD